MFKQLPFRKDRCDFERERNADRYRLVMDARGRMRCSCGRELIRMDEMTYRCTGGYPIFRIDAGDIIKGKDGELYLRHKPHGGGVNE